LTEATYVGNSNAVPYSMGADYMWQRDVGNLYYTDGNVGIGTTTPTGLLDVNGKLVVKTDGNVGIGTTAPAVELDIEGVVRAGSGGSITGSLGFEIDYSGANVINTWSTEYSSSDSVFGIAVRSKNGVANVFTSTAGNAAFAKGALVLGDDLEFFNAAGATVAIGDDVTMTSRFKIDSTGNVGIGTTSPTQAKLVVSGGIYVTGDVSALTFTDRTPFYDGDALSEIKLISGIDGEIDHSTLPEFVQVNKTKIIYEKQNVSEEVFNETLNKTISVIIEKEVEIGTESTTERNIGNMISVLTKGVQQLIYRIIGVEDRTTQLENEIILLKSELCKKDNTYSWCVATPSPIK